MARPVKKPFVQVDTDFDRSVEFLMFAQELREALPEHERGGWVAVAFMGVYRVWAACLERVSNGNLAEIAPEIVEEWAGFRGVSGAFFRAFVAHLCEQTAEGIVIRGWEKRYGVISAKRAKDVERKRLAASGSHEKPDVSSGNHTKNGTDLYQNTGGFQRKLTGKGTESVPRSKKLESNYFLSPDGERHEDDWPPEFPPETAPETPPDSDVLDLLDDVGPAAPASAVRSPRRRPPASPPPAKPLAKYPHFPSEVRAELMAVWRDELMPLREDQKGRFVQAFAGWFTQPEAERPPHLPTNSEVVDALRAMMGLRREMAGGERLAVPSYAAERIGMVVDVLRENTADPFERTERLERVLGLRSAVRNDPRPFRTS